MPTPQSLATPLARGELSPQWKLGLFLPLVIPAQAGIGTMQREQREPTTKYCGLSRPPRPSGHPSTGGEHKPRRKKQVRRMAHYLLSILYYLCSNKKHAERRVFYSGGCDWTRTNDLFDVNEAL